MTVTWLFDRPTGYDDLDPGIQGGIDDMRSGSVAISGVMGGGQGFVDDTPGDITWHLNPYGFDRNGAAKTITVTRDCATGAWTFFVAIEGFVGIFIERRIGFGGEIPGGCDGGSDAFGYLTGFNQILAGNVSIVISNNDCPGSSS